MEWNCVRNDSYAQSETIGVLLLTGVVIILIGVVSVFVLGGINTTTDPVADLRIAGNDTHLTVDHNGGDRFSVGELRVIIDGETDRTRFDVAAGNVTGSDEQFTFGDRLVREHGFGSQPVTIRVIHVPTSTIVAEKRLDLNPN